MEEIQKCCALETKKFFVMGWDTLIFLFNLYILYNDIIFIIYFGVITLMTLLSFALSIMWIVHYIYNCGTQYSEKYEWVIYIKFVYLINIIPYVYYLMVGYSFNFYNIPLILFMYLISFVLEYIYLIHLKISRKQENANNAPTPSQGIIPTNPNPSYNYNTSIIPPEQPQVQQVYYGQTVQVQPTQAGYNTQQNDQYCPPSSINDNYQQYSKPDPGVNSNNSNQ